MSKITRVEIFDHERINPLQSDINLFLASWQTKHDFKLIDIIYSTSECFDDGCDCIQSTRSALIIYEREDPEDE